MKIPDKLPNPQKYRDFPELTKEEWEDYYACREKYDIEMTEDENGKLEIKHVIYLKKALKKRLVNCFLKFLLIHF